MPDRSSRKNGGEADEGLGCLFILALLAFGVWFGIWGKDSALRYSVQYKTDRDRVTVDRKPTDCDFMHAPLGRKDCHYVKRVFVANHSRNSEGQPIVSYDDGKTWYLNPGGYDQGVSVSVEWVKQTP